MYIRLVLSFLLGAVQALHSVARIQESVKFTHE